MLVVLLSWAPTTKFHGLDGLNNRYLFLPVMDAKKTEIKVLADSVPAEDPFSCWLPSHWVLTWERKPLVSLPLPTRTLIPSWRALPLCLQLNLIISQDPIPKCYGIGYQGFNKNFGGVHFKSITVVKCIIMRF